MSDLFFELLRIKYVAHASHSVNVSCSTLHPFQYFIFSCIFVFQNTRVSYIVYSAVCNEKWKKIKYTFLTTVNNHSKSRTENSESTGIGLCRNSLVLKNLNVSKLDNS